LPGWFTKLFVVALVGFALSWSGDLVLGTSIVSFGLMLPVWYVAANLWWVMLALVPAMLGRTPGRKVLGLAVGVAVVGGLAVGTIALDRRTLATLTPALPLPKPGLAVEAGPPRSVEIAGLFGRSPDQVEDACGDFCQALLSGPDVTWLRVETGASRHATTGAASEALPKAGTTVVFYRGDEAECRALDPGFPAGSPCILARSDDGAKADLLVEVTQEGDFFAPMDPAHGRVYLTGIERLFLKDQRVSPPKTLDERLRYGWSAPVLGPLVPAMTALGNGAKSDGPGFRRARKQSDPFDLAAILTHAGVRLGVPVANLPDADALAIPTARLASILALSDGEDLGPGQSQLAKDWMLQFREPATAGAVIPQVGEGERRVFRRLLAMLGSLDFGRALTDMLASHPEYFVEDFRAVLRLIVTGTDREVYYASQAANLALYRSKRGDHDAAWADYVAAVKSGRGTEDLVLWVGRFSFDPVPLLRDELARVRPNGYDAPFRAVCDIDPRWYPEIVTLFYAAALGFAPSAGETVFRGLELGSALRALRDMDRRDLAEAALRNVDWSVAQAVPDWAGSPGKAERFRKLLEEHLDADGSC
jgi:hypothetical protein